MSLVRLAFSRDRFAFALVTLLVLAGAYVYAGFSSQEEPTLPVNSAVIQAQNPGLDAPRMEELVTRPIERSLRELREAKNIITTTRSGSTHVRFEIHDGTPSYDLAWQRLREKMADLRGRLPAGTIGPIINDDFGRVAVATFAITAPGRDWRAFRYETERLRDRVAALPGVEGVALHGVVAERVRVSINPELQAQLAPHMPELLRQIEQRIMAVSAGHITIGGVELVIDPRGAFSGVDAIADMAVSIAGGHALLSDIARVERAPVDPLEVAAFHNGERAIVLAISMAPGRDVTTFTVDLRRHVDRFSAALPQGYSVVSITDQGAVTTDVIGDMTSNLVQTVVVILIVTIIALGWRGGLVVGMLVSVTMLISLLILRAMSIDLNIVSTAAFIIALGILVDNGNVVVDETERLISEGAAPRDAAIMAAEKLAKPLLVATTATLLTFLPPVFTDNILAIYMQNLTKVMLVTLAVSWVVSVTVAPLMAELMLSRSRVRAARPGGHDDTDRAPPVGLVAAVFALVVRRPRSALAVVGGGFAVSLGLASAIPSGFLPNSERAQFQIQIEAAPGSSAAWTASRVEQISRWLSDRDTNPEVIGATAYVGEGGPRFILGLNPTDPASHRAYVVTNVARKADVAPVIARLRNTAQAAFPDLLIEPKPFSLGSTESGQAVIRITASDEGALRVAAQRIKAAMRAQSGVIDTRDDWETRLFRIALEPREAAMRLAGVTVQQVMAAASQATTGTSVSVLRDRDQQVPVLVRTGGDQHALERLLDTRIITAAGAVSMSEVVTVTLASETSVIQKRNLLPTITVVGRHPAWTAQQLIDAVRPELAALPPGATVSFGGEIEENETATLAIFAALPACLIAMVMLFILQFNSMRRVTIIVLTIPFCAVGIILTLVAFQAPFDFMSNLGLFALIGTIISNAILIIEQFDEEEASGVPFAQAIVVACTKRFRPIVVTQATTILGLLPLLLSREPLWFSFNLVVMGGLVAGTIGSLVIVPALLRLMFPEKAHANVYQTPAPAVSPVTLPQGDHP